MAANPGVPGIVLAPKLGADALNVPNAGVVLPNEVNAGCEPNACVCGCGSGVGESPKLMGPEETTAEPEDAAKVCTAGLAAAAWVVAASGAGLIAMASVDDAATPD